MTYNVDVAIFLSESNVAEAAMWRDSHYADEVCGKEQRLSQSE